MGGMTALHYAAERPENDKMIDLLCTHNADPNAMMSGSGNTPLLMACSCGITCNAQALLNAKAVVNMPNARDKRTPLHQARGHGQESLIKLLLENGADEQ